MLNPRTFTPLTITEPFDSDAGNHNDALRADYEASSSGVSDIRALSGKKSVKKQLAKSQSKIESAFKKTPERVKKAYHCLPCGTQDFYYDLANHLKKHSDIYFKGISSRAYFELCDEKDCPHNNKPKKGKSEGSFAQCTQTGCSLQTGCRTDCNFQTGCRTDCKPAADRLQTDCRTGCNTRF